MLVLKENYELLSCQQQFLRHLERMEYSGETRKGYEKDLQFFNRFITEQKGKEEIFLNEVLKDDLLAFMDLGRKMGHTTNTIARRVSTIKSFYKFLVNELDYTIDVAARIRLPKAYIPLRNVLTESEIQMLLDYVATVDPKYHLLYSILYYTGSRLTAVRTLERKNVLLDRRMIYFPKVKGGKDLYLPIHDKLMNIFVKYFQSAASERKQYLFYSKKFPNQPVSATDVRLKLRKYAIAVKIDKNITPHSIRHATATHLTIKKVDQRTIASILGHTDLRSTIRYQHLAIEHLREPINVLS